jgi:hypothetical protein
LITLPIPDVSVPVLDVSGKYRGDGLRLMAVCCGSDWVGLRARVLALVVVVLVVLAGAGRARAGVVHHPQGAFAVFSDCPLNNPSVVKCMVATTTGGELRLGSVVMPITKTFQSLRGGYGAQGAEGMSSFFPPESEASIQPMPLPVPGGLTGMLEPSLLPSSLRAAFVSLVDTGLGGLTVTLELAGPASAIRFSTYNTEVEEGVALEESVKIKLTNAFLGEDCYIGSASDPIVLQATTGETSLSPPSKPLVGKTGLPQTSENDELTSLSGNVDVASSFAVPAASGCGGSLAPLVDRAIDARVGLPSPAGRNDAILDNAAELATPTSVIDHE